MDACLVAQSCLTLCDPLDCSPSDSSVFEIFRQEFGVRCCFLLQGDLPSPRIEPTSLVSPALQDDSLPAEQYIYLHRYQFIRKVLYHYNILPFSTTEVT